jgi:hypothetical protein
MAKKITIWVMGILVALGLVYCGYNIYDYYNYKNISLAQSEFENKVYVTNSNLWGHETLSFMHYSEQDHDWVDVNIPLNSVHIENFETETPGKKLARIRYQDEYIEFRYYVVKPHQYNSLNCISAVKNFIPTFYLNEAIDLNKVYIEYNEFVDGYMVQSNVPVTFDMLVGFNTSTLGKKTLLINYKGCTYDLVYHVIEKPTEKVTSESFGEYGVYYAEDTVELTEHFYINIKADSYLLPNYKYLIEKIYDIEEQVSGLKFPTGRRIQLDIYGGSNGIGGGSAGYVQISHAYLFTSIDSVFIHELAHSLNISQKCVYIPSDTIIEGFASYIEYLTVKEIHENYPELSQYVHSPGAALHSLDGLHLKMYFYDFEDKILKLDRDELTFNSQYEAGARFFAYLHHRFGDFCSWMEDERSNTSKLEEFTAFLKDYYGKQSLFDDFYPYEQSFGNRYASYCGVNNLVYFWDTSDSFFNIKSTNLYPFDLAANNQTLKNKINYYFNFGLIKESRDNMQIVFKDLYINLESLNHQLQSMGENITNKMIKIEEGITVELYNAGGELLRIVEDSSTAFNVDDVSFIKLVGAGVATIDMTYEDVILEEPVE